MKTKTSNRIKNVPFNNLLLTGLVIGMMLSFGFLLNDVQAVSVAGSSAETEEVRIFHQQSTILETPWKVVRVAITDPVIADVQVLTPNQVLVQGLAVGTTDIILWNEDETEILQKKVNVVFDVDGFNAAFAEMFPSSDLQVSQSGRSLIIKGQHRSAIHADQLHQYLEGWSVLSTDSSSSGRNASYSYVDMTEVAGVQQVELQVRVAEVSRTGLRSLGANWFQAGNDFTSGISPGELISGAAGATLPAADGTASFLGTGGITATTSSGITVFGALPRADLTFFLEALAENQYLRLLANPTLIALNGEEASFLAGGEFPIPVPQSGSGGEATITIDWKEYGVRLNFMPIVQGNNTIKLYAAPEVSELDYANGTSINGTVVPGVLSRKAETTIELKSGQSFAIAGLLRDSVTTVNSSVPGLGDLPVLGPLFRSVSYQSGETELVILVTANLVEPMNVDPKAAPMPGMLHEAPDDWELYIDGQIESDEPAKLNSIDAKWLEDLGLDQLNGPGAWDSYETSAPVSESELVPMIEE